MLKLRPTLPKYFNIDTVTLTFAANSSLQVRNFTFRVSWYYIRPKMATAAVATVAPVNVKWRGNIPQQWEMYDRRSVWTLFPRFVTKSVINTYAGLIFVFAYVI